MEPKNNPYYNGEFERAVREAGVARAVCIGEGLAEAVVALGRLTRTALQGFRPADSRDPALTPRASAAQHLSGD